MAVASLLLVTMMDWEVICVDTFHVSGRCASGSISTTTLTTGNSQFQTTPHATSPSKGRADTLQKDILSDYHFSNQNDDIPQPLKLLPGKHLGFGGVPESEPWTMDDELTFDGKTFKEYSVDEAGHQEAPNIIAMSTVIGGHLTDVQHDSPCKSGFKEDSTITEGKQINTLCVYNGHKVGVGRVLTESSFHHYCDLNVIGDPCALDEKTIGFDSARLEETAAFFTNCVLWLANPSYWK
ncbi:hypothetical protein N431DRAFT_462036 [Stipitochalara longipes BDJ]|nr:hypothetical protein N431DRAFT_462036 [Stipitochalara longipes BDJ]